MYSTTRPLMPEYCVIRTDKKREEQLKQASAAGACKRRRRLQAPQALACTTLSRLETKSFLVQVCEEHFGIWSDRTKSDQSWPFKSPRISDSINGRLRDGAFGTTTVPKARLTNSTVGPTVMVSLAPSRLKRPAAQSTAVSPSQCLRHRAWNISRLGIWK